MTAPIKRKSDEAGNQPENAPSGGDDDAWQVAAELPPTAR